MLPTILPTRNVKYAPGSRYDIASRAFREFDPDIKDEVLAPIIADDLLER